jgi:hypothetical protein
MPIKSVWLGLNFEEAALDHSEKAMPAKPMLSSFAPARKPIFPSSWQRPVDQVQVGFDYKCDLFVRLALAGR